MANDYIDDTSTANAANSISKSPKSSSKCDDRFSTATKVVLGVCAIATARGAVYLGLV